MNTSVKIKIGLESHVQLKTKSKLFCSCSAEQGSSTEANQNTCEVCLGFPGSKPVFNKRALELAIQLSKIMDCKVSFSSRFARKIYFYPDLSKAYQITQYDEPLSEKGEFIIEIGNDGKTVTTKKIRITRVHIEEDPGKIEYVGGHIGTATSVLVDYNRSGLPLCEVVTEPDFSSINEAVTYVKKLFEILSYVGILDSNREGSMRTDANISIDGGERVELKNISGSDVLEKALKAELHRQTFLKTRGDRIGRETRTYSDETGTTILLRKKEQEEDYGYIYEPDLLPIELTDKEIQEIQKQMKKLPSQVYDEILIKYKLAPQIAKQLAFKRGLYEYFQVCLKTFKKTGDLAKWLVGDFLKCANWHNYEIEKCPKEENFLELMFAIENKKITEREAKELIKKMFDNPDKKLSELNKDGKEAEGDIDKIIAEVIAQNKETVGKIKAGDEKSINFLVGQVLRKTNFKADPKEMMEKIREIILG